MVSLLLRDYDAWAGKRREMEKEISVEGGSKERSRGETDSGNHELTYGGRNGDN